MAIGIPYVGHLVRGDMPYIEDARGMSVTGLVLGLVAFFVASRDVPQSLRTTFLVVAAASLAVGVAALAFAETAAAGVLLAVFMGSILVVWMLGMSGYVLNAGSGQTRRLTHA